MNSGEPSAGTRSREANLNSSFFLANQSGSKGNLKLGLGIAGGFGLAFFVIRRAAKGRKIETEDAFISCIKAIIAKGQTVNIEVIYSEKTNDKSNPRIKSCAQVTCRALVGEKTKLRYTRFLGEHEFLLQRPFTDTHNSYLTAWKAATQEQAARLKRQLPSVRISLRFSNGEAWTAECKEALKRDCLAHGITTDDINLSFFLERKKA